MTKQAKTPKEQKIRKYHTASDLVKDMKSGKLSNELVWLDERATAMKPDKEILMQLMKNKMNKREVRAFYNNTLLAEKQGYAKALNDVEKMCGQMKVETGYKGCLRDFYGYNKALSNIKKEIAKLKESK